MSNPDTIKTRWKLNLLNSSLESRIPMKTYTLSLIFLIITMVSTLPARTLESIPYYAAAENDYQAEQCHLDLYIPDGADGYSTVVWFHGGGLKNGKRYIPE